MKKLIPVFFSLMSSLVWAQSDVDSLQMLLEKKTLKIVERIDLLNKLSADLRRSDPFTSIRYSNKSLALAKQAGYKKGEGVASIAVSEYYWSKTEFDQSLQHGLSALQICESIGYEKGIADACMILALTYDRLHEAGQSVNYLNRSLSLALKLKDSEGIARAYNSFGVKANSRRDHKEAFRLFSKALSHLPTNSASHIKVLILCNIGFYYKNYDPDKALPTFEKALVIAKREHNKSGEAFTHFNIGLTHQGRKQYLKAEEHLLQAKKLAEETRDKGRLQEVYLSLIQLKTLTLDALGAHHYHQKYAAIRDSIFKAEKAQQIARLETRYETEKKEQAIKLLEQEKLVQAVWRNALIAVVVLTILSSFFIYNLQRSRATKAKQLLEIQQILNDKLKEVDKLKSVFFANISHEFRTPLTLILSPLENELKKRPVHEQEDLLLMRRNANRLLELVNQILDLSKLDAGKMQLHVIQGDILSFLKVVIASFHSWSQHRKIHFAQYIEVADRILWYDKEKLETIITNLLANAFKFTPADGKVTLSVVQKKSGTHNIVAIAVSDTGRGIPDEEQKQVFSSFYQSRQTIERHDGGTGLGLSLVKELVKLYGGTISLESTTGIGTTFLVELPANKEAFSDAQLITGAPSVSHPSEALPKEYAIEDNETDDIGFIAEGKDSILIVEDNHDLRNFIAGTLEPKFTVRTARDGKEG